MLKGRMVQIGQSKKCTNLNEQGDGLSPHFTEKDHKIVIGDPPFRCFFIDPCASIIFLLIHLGERVPDRADAQSHYAQGQMEMAGNEGNREHVCLEAPSGLTQARG